jgi:hypothetical protein
MKEPHKQQTYIYSDNGIHTVTKTFTTLHPATLQPHITALVGASLLAI